MVQHFRFKQATCKCQELHAPGKQTGRSMHVRTYLVLIFIRTLIGTYLVCCFVHGGLRFAVLYFAVLYFAVFAVQRHTLFGYRIGIPLASGSTGLRW